MSVRTNKGWKALEQALARNRKNLDQFSEKIQGLNSAASTHRKPSSSSAGKAPARHHDGDGDGALDGKARPKTGDGKALEFQLNESLRALEKLSKRIKALEDQVARLKKKSQ